MGGYNYTYTSLPLWEIQETTYTTEEPAYWPEYVNEA
jgi:hypothetical protein